MKIAVTGAGGFVGRHVVAALEESGHALTLATRTNVDARWARAGHNVVSMDITRELAPFQALGRPDVLIHLAWDGLPNYTAVRHVEIELPNQLEFIARAVRGGLANLLVTGTCLEYGMRSGCLDETLVTVPVVPYAAAKDQLRRELERLRGTSGFKLTWARMFYLYGRHQAPTSLYSQLASAVAKKERVFNMSGGEQVRDYMAAEDAARCLTALATSADEVGIVNVCSGTPVKVVDLVRGWIVANEWSIALNRGYYPYPEYEPMEFWGDRRKLDAHLKAENK